MRLLPSRAGWVINDREVTAREAAKVTTRHESFTDKIGQGEKLIVEYQFSGGTPSFRYELSLYQGEPWISATAYLPKGDYRLGDFSLVQGKVQVQEAFRTRVYINSGNSNYSNSGVWQLGMRRWSSSAVSVYYEPKIEEALSLAFYSFQRASTSVISQYDSSKAIGVNAAAHYNGYRPQEGELTTETLLISLGHDPLRLLEDWADTVVKVVQPKFNHDTRTGATNLWYAYGNKTTEKEIDRASQVAAKLDPALLRNYHRQCGRVAVAARRAWCGERSRFGRGPGRQAAVSPWVQVGERSGPRARPANQFRSQLCLCRPGIIHCQEEGALDCLGRSQSYGFRISH